jgi:hypothetical protein
MKASVLVDAGTMLEILQEGARYRLRWGWPGNWKVVYEGDASAHRRTIGGRSGKYEFRSVEQLRYDLERDAAEAEVTRR